MGRSLIRRQLDCHTVLMVGIGFACGFFIASYIKSSILNAHLHCDGSDDNFQPYIPPKYNDLESSKSLVFVGVMTAQKFLDTRAVAVFKTWGTVLPGKLGFFSSEGSRSSYADVPVIALEGVDDAYPPQKKSFLMMKFMHDNYIDKFEWFVRADDDLYIRGDKLENFLRSVNSSKPQFIGQAGLGTSEEFGTLGLGPDENFCMGGPGMIMSQTTLRLMAPHIKYCLKHLGSTHEDVEIGRCIRRFVGIPCTWSYEMQNIFYHNSSGLQAYTMSLKSKEVHQAISLHPIKIHQYQYRLHNYIRGLKIKDLLHKTLRIHRDIRDAAGYMSTSTDSSSNSDTSGLLDELDAVLGLSPQLKKFVPVQRSDVLTWDFISRVIFSDNNFNPKRGMEAQLKAALEDIVMQVMSMINKHSRQRGRIIDFKEILYGYCRYDPLHGADYILDLLLVYKKYRGRKMTVPVRRHAYLQQTFTQLEFILDEELEEFYPVPGSTPSRLEQGAAGGAAADTPQQLKLFNMLKNGLSFTSDDDDGRLLGSDMLQQQHGLGLPGLSMGGQSHEQRIHSNIIHFILPLAGRFNTFTRFMQNFEHVCLKNNEAVKLLVVLFPQLSEPSDDRTDDTKQLVKDVQSKYPTYDLQVLEAKGPFSRGLALDMGARQYADDALLFFVDVDIYFSQAFLDRVRFNTRQHRLVYYPVVYSQYDPIMVPNSDSSTKDVFTFTHDGGYWRQFGFGIVSMYNSDFRDVGGFDTTIIGWGKEDVKLFESYAASNISIFRSVDPGLVHIFHPIICDPNLDSAQYQMCLGSKSTSYGSTARLADIVYSNPELLNFNSDSSSNSIDQENKKPQLQRS